MYKRQLLPLILGLKLSGTAVAQECTTYSVLDKPVTGTPSVYVNGRYHIENGAFQAASVEAFRKSYVAAVSDVIAEQKG